MSEQQKGRAFVALAAVAWSTAGLFQRELSVDTATQIAGRAAFAALGLLVYVVAVERRRTLRAFRALGLSGLAVAALIAVSSASIGGGRLLWTRLSVRGPGNARLEKRLFHRGFEAWLTAQTRLCS